MRILQTLGTPQGIQPGQTATQLVPIGPSYHRLNIRAKAMIGGSATDIPIADWGNHFGDIRVVKDGETLMEFDAATYVKILKYYGFALSAGVLPILFSQPWTRNMIGEDQTILGTVGITNLALEMDLKDGDPLPLLKIYAEQDEPRPFGPHLRIQRFANQMGQSGEKEMADIPRGQWNTLAYHLDTPNIGALEVVGDGFRFHQSDKVTRQALLKAAGRTAQTGMTHIDFMLENRMSDVLPMTFQDFRLKGTFTAAAANFFIYAITVRGA